MIQLKWKITVTFNNLNKLAGDHKPVGKPWLKPMATSLKKQNIEYFNVLLYFYAFKKNTSDKMRSGFILIFV